jgi:hypothetical protein
MELKLVFDDGTIDRSQRTEVMTESELRSTPIRVQACSDIAHGMQPEVPAHPGRMPEPIGIGPWY